MRVLPTAALAFLLTALPGVASAQAPTQNFFFEHGTANYRTWDGPIAFENYSGGERQAPCPPPGAPTCTYEAHEFEIAPGEVNGKVQITLTWANEDNDWDLYLYRVQDDGTVDESDPIASAASFGDTDEVATLVTSEEPIPPGTYRIYIDNYQNADTDYDWFVGVAFEGWFPPNDPPTAAFTAPATAVAGQPVTLDASASRDEKGVVNYAWDLDGDGRFETDAGASPVHQAPLAPGRRHVGLRVRDAEGRSAHAAATIDVAPAPVAPPQPPPSDGFALPPAPGRIALDLASPQRLDAVLARGLRATIECPSSCKIRASLRISAATARRLGLGNRAMTIARRTRDQSGRSFPRIRLKPPLRVRRAMRGEESVRATLRMVVTAQGFSPQTYTRPVQIVD